LREEWSTVSRIAGIFRVAGRLKGLIRPAVVAIVRVPIVSVADCLSSTFRIVELAQGIARPVRRWMRI
jgi:hypothetical protein